MKQAVNATAGALHAACGIILWFPVQQALAAKRCHRVDQTPQVI
jgi:hypothetical protein